MKTRRLFSFPSFQLGNEVDDGSDIRYANATFIHSHSRERGSRRRSRCRVRSLIGRQGSNPGIGRRATDRKVINTLKLGVPKTKQFVHGIVEKASDARPGNTGRLRLQVEKLADHAALPKEPFVEPSPVGIQRRPKSGNHAKAECAVPGDILSATEGLGNPGGISRPEEIERQVGGTTGRGFPPKVSMGRPFDIGPRIGLPNQQVKAGRQGVHAMREKGEMDHGRPREVFTRGHDPRQYSVKGLPRKGGSGIHGNGASSFLDHPVCGKPFLVREGMLSRGYPFAWIAVRHSVGNRFLNEAARRSFDTRRFPRGLGGYPDQWPVVMGITKRIRLTEPLPFGDAVKEAIGDRAPGRFPLGLQLYGDDQFRYLLFTGPEFMGPVEAERGGDLPVANAIQEAYPPAQYAGGDIQGQIGVSAIMLAITKGAFTVFPSLAPADGGKTHEKDIRRQQVPSLLRKLGSNLQGVFLWGVVVDAGGLVQPGQGWQDTVPFRGVQISARRVDAQRPTTRAGLFPGGDRQGIFEESPDGFLGKPLRGNPSGREDILVWRALVAFLQGEWNGFGTHEFPKRIGLIRPIEIAEGSRVTVEVMLGGLVVVLYRLDIVNVMCLHIMGSLSRPPSCRGIGAHGGVMVLDSDTRSAPRRKALYSTLDSPAHLRGCVRFYKAPPYGSRAEGNHRPGSDIDPAIIGSDIVESGDIGAG